MWIWSCSDYCKAIHFQFSIFPAFAMHGTKREFHREGAKTQSLLCLINR